MKLFAVLVMVLMLAPAIASADVALDTSCNLTTGTYSELMRNYSTITYNNSFQCPNGCANNELECDSPAQPESFFAFAMVFAAAAFTFAYIALRLDEEFRALQVMFLGFSVTYIAFVSYIVSGFATLTLNTLNTIMVQSYVMGVFTVLGVVFYFMYVLVRRLLDLLLAAKDRGRPVKWS